jgi:hypothetical protein
MAGVSIGDDGGDAGLGASQRFHCVDGISTQHLCDYAIVARIVVALGVVKTVVNTAVGFALIS